MASADVLIVKTSSLGDVVHNMPAVTDLRRFNPHCRVSWLVEEDYAPLVRLHPAVDEVIPVAMRRWRRQPHRAQTWREIRRFTRDLRERRHDLVVDTQGLSRSAILAAIARGQRHGYDSASIRERFAAPFYQVRHRVRRDLHAIDRNRALLGLAAGYTPSGPPDYGLARESFDARGAAYAVLLHGTARPEKEWPEGNWAAVGQVLRESGLEIALPWGNARERARSEAIAQVIGAGVRIPDRTPLDRTAGLLAASTLVVGLDTGLLHLAAAYAVPCVAIFGGSDPALTGPRGAGRLTVLGAEGRPPSLEEVIAAVRETLSAQAP